MRDLIFTEKILSLMDLGLVISNTFQVNLQIVHQAPVALEFFDEKIHGLRSLFVIRIVATFLLIEIVIE